MGPARRFVHPALQGRGPVSTTRGYFLNPDKDESMKFYVILLAILYLLQMYLSFTSIFLFGVNYLYILGHIGNIVLYTLCLSAAVEFAYKKRVIKLSRTNIWWVGRLTLLLGAYTTLLYTRGDIFGMPSPPSNFLHAALIFLPYVLFAIPVIVYEYELRKKEQGS